MKSAMKGTRRREVARSGKLANYLGKLRVQNKLTLLDVQEKSKIYQDTVSFDYLSRAERGILLPSLTKLLTLSRVYRISPAVFFDLIEVGQYEKIKPDIHDYKDCKTYAINCVIHGDIDKAIGAFSRCIEIVSKDKNLKDKDEKFSEVYLSAGIAFRQKGKLTLAKEELEKASKNGNISPSLKMRILNEFANVYLEEDNVVLAHLFADSALKLAQEKRDASTLGTAHCTKANILSRVSALEESKMHLRRAIGIFEAMKNVHNLVAALISLGHCLNLMKKYDQAISAFEKAMFLTEKEGLKKQHAVVLTNLGDMHRQIGKHDRAKLYLMEASRISREHEYVKTAFSSNFYLWKIAKTEKDEFGEKEFFKTLKFYRTKIQEIFDEVKEYDSYLSTLK